MLLVYEACSHLGFESLALRSSFSEACQLSHEVKIGVPDNQCSHSYTEDMIAIPISAFEPEETMPSAKSAKSREGVTYFARDQHEINMRHVTQWGTDGTVNGTSEVHCSYGVGDTDFLDL